MIYIAATDKNAEAAAEAEAGGERQVIKTRNGGR